MIMTCHLPLKQYCFEQCCDHYCLEDSVGDLLGLDPQNHE